MSDQLDNKPPASKQIKSVETAIEYFKKGKMVIIVDDEGRENEGDIALPAEDCTPDNINFMATIARGLICTPLDGDIIDNLELEPMVTRNTESMGTAFTVSVDASSGIESGISAKDRSNTVKKLSDTKSTREDFVKPGHIFPLRYQKGGVLVRAGHTEGSVDLVKLSGKRPAAVICEVMNEDGTMARIDDLKKVSEKMGNVSYIGSIHPDNVPLQTIESDAVLMALDPKNDNNRMSAPNKLFEAMSAGVPIITCKELLMGQFVENEEIGLTFEWGKWDRLKAAIMKLVYDKELHTKMGKRGRKLAEKTHNWDKCEERIESLYRYVKLNGTNLP